jgi:lipoyl(octanoyl) transferase
MWYFFDTGSRSGTCNMDFDEWLARVFFPRTGISCFRLYGWSPPAVSLGFHQNIRDIDVERCISDGIDIVRRPTGGRAILHEEEITYSVVTDATGYTTQELYRRISMVVLAGLRDAGYQVTFSGKDPDYRTEYRTTRAIPCFASSGRYEILMDGKKLVGSAQRRHMLNDGTVVALQHGSILTGRAHVRLAKYLTVNEMEAEIISHELARTTTTLTDTGTEPVSIQEVKNRLFDAARQLLAGRSYEIIDATPLLDEFRRSSIQSPEKTV